MGLVKNNYYQIIIKKIIITSQISTQSHQSTSHVEERVERVGQVSHGDEGDPKGKDG